MRRYYAFESEELPSAVKDQLEKVEGVVDEKCTSVEACDKMLDKISAEQEKFNGCLKDMASAAKDCQDGKCDTAELAAKVSPKMAELKEVAKSIGVASEGETVSEAEVQAAKQYLEGAEEIVEAKKDELSGESKKNDDSDDDSDAAIEAFMTDLTPATEGQNWQALKGVLAGNAKDARAAVKASKKLAKSGDTAGAIAKLQEAKRLFGEAKNTLQKLPKDMWDTVSSWVNASLMSIVFAVIGHGFEKENESKNLNIAGAIGYLNQAMAACDKKIAALKTKSGTDTDGTQENASEAFIDFIEACESFMIRQPKKTAPYLFD